MATTSGRAASSDLVTRACASLFTLLLLAAGCATTPTENGKALPRGTPLGNTGYAIDLPAGWAIRKADGGNLVHFGFSRQLWKVGPEKDVALQPGATEAVYYGCGISELETGIHSSIADWLATTSPYAEDNLVEAVTTTPFSAALVDALRVEERGENATRAVSIYLMHRSNLFRVGYISRADGADAAAMQRIAPDCEQVARSLRPQETP